MVQGPQDSAWNTYSSGTFLSISEETGLIFREENSKFHAQIKKFMECNILVDLFQQYTKESSNDCTDKNLAQQITLMADYLETTTS